MIEPLEPMDRLRLICAGRGADVVRRELAMESQRRAQLRRAIEEDHRAALAAMGAPDVLPPPVVEHEEYDTGKVDWVYILCVLMVAVFSAWMVCGMIGINP